MDRLNGQEHRKLPGSRALRNWESELPATEDYEERVEKVAVPDDLPSGFYFLVSSFDPDFTKQQDNQTNYAGFWVSNLALIVRTPHGRGEVGGFVLDALSGDPIKGARVQGWGRKDGKRVKVNSVNTDENGQFSFFRGGAEPVATGQL